MELRGLEIHNIKPESQNEKNKRIVDFISKKIEEFIKFQEEGLYMKKFSETDFGYNNSEQSKRIF